MLPQKGCFKLKLLIAIINNDDSHRILNAIGRAGLYATRLSTSGGFLRSGNLTLIMGVEEERVDEALEILRKNCSKREETTVPIPALADDILGPVPVKITVGGAVVFVLDVEQFHKM